jgi:hypothetical protein
MAKQVSKTTTDHETIRRWAEERGGWPADVEATAREGDTGIIRIDFPGFSGEGSLRRISWDDWFRKFDASGLAFVYEDQTAGGERSNFNKLVSRETAAARAEGARTTRAGGARGAARRRTGAARAKRGPAGGKRTAARGAAAGRKRTGGPAAAGERKRTAARGASRPSARAGGRREVSRPEAARTTGRRSGASGRSGGASKRRGGGGGRKR